MYVETSELHFCSPHISIQKNCQPVQNPLILYYPHAYPPHILSHPMHTLPLFYPTPCMPSPYSIHPMHALPYSIPPMHALPLFYPTSCMPSPLFYPSPCILSPYSIPAHVYPPPILSQLMHTLPLFYASLYTPSPYSIPQYACPLLVTWTWKASFSFDIWECRFWMCSHWVHHHHLPSLKVIWSIN